MAVAVFPEDVLEKLPIFTQRARDFLERHPELGANIHLPTIVGAAGHRMLSILNEDKLRRVLARMLDENEFFSPYGIRSLSRVHLEHPFVFHHLNQTFTVQYLPGDSDSGMFGGNSNWRGPVWMPVNFLLYKSLLRLYEFYGDAFTIECPTGSGVYMNLLDVAKELGERLTRIFLKDEKGDRPVYGGAEKFQKDPHWKDLILFYEYFHADNGAGIGASHQTGWTGCIARLIQIDMALTKEMFLGSSEEEIIRLIGGF